MRGAWGRKNAALGVFAGELHGGRAQYVAYGGVESALDASLYCIVWNAHKRRNALLQT